MRRAVLPVCLVVASSPLFAQFNSTLKPETLAEFGKYQSNADREMALQIKGAKPFQWVEQRSDMAARARAGEVVTYAFTGSHGLSVPGGLVHDWVGVIYLDGAKLEAVRDFLLDTDRQSKAYAEVTSAKTLSRAGDRSVTKLRIVKKKILTAVLEIEYENTWQAPGPGKWAFAARSRKVVEIEDAGTPQERPLPVDTGHGFLWRMNSQWLLRQDPGGVWVELRVVSLSRDTPRGLGFIVRPFIRDFPVEGITSTLRQTQAALKR